MKFRLATVFWITAVICLAIGWFCERSFYQQKLEEQVGTQVSVESVLSGSLCEIIYCVKLDELGSGERTQAEFDEFRENSLLKRTAYLFLNEELATNTMYDLSDGVTFSSDQKGRIMRFAGQLISLTGAKNNDDLNRLFGNHSALRDWLGDELFSTDGRMNEEFSNFTERSLQYYKDQVAGRPTIDTRN